jgi:DNA (cytosine-5)-methyltransferase 1
VEWLMGLAPGWITDSDIGLTHAQQLTALGNGVMPTQAEAALRKLIPE